MVITFDDGYISPYTLGYPYLKSKGILATIYYLPCMLGLKSYLNWQSVIKLRLAGWDIQCHFNHEDYLTEAELKAQFQKHNDYWKYRMFSVPEHHAPHIGITELGTEVSRLYRKTSTLESIQPEYNALSTYDTIDLHELIRCQSDASTDIKLGYVLDRIDDAYENNKIIITLNHDFTSEDDPIFLRWKQMIDYGIQKGMTFVTISQMYRMIVRYRKLHGIPV
jgi:peptidoglycan/xylan/chitin deacetylase (PgdA/CDA1 family)